MSKVISIVSQKGGVGKSTTSINLAASLALVGRRVLLLDFDPQGNATRGLGYNSSLLKHTIFDAMTSSYPIEMIVKDTKTPNLSLIPSNVRLTGFLDFTDELPVDEKYVILKEKLNYLRESFDYIIIDCPPSFGVLHINALAASDSVIVPVQCELLAANGISSILSSISKIKNKYNPNLKIEGFLLTMYDKKSPMCDEVVQEIRTLFRENTFVTVIPRNHSILEAIARGVPVTSFRPTSIASKSYICLAREVLSNE